MKYKFIYSLSLISLYSSTTGYLLATWRLKPLEGSFFLLSSFIFYKISSTFIYSAKEWIKDSLFSFLIFLIALFFETPFISFGIAISFLGATFIQLFLDEMCRSKEE